MKFLSLIDNPTFDNCYQIAPLIIGAGIAAGASLLSSGMNNAANAAAIEKYNEGQMELAKYQNQYNLDMWNRTNEYNSPIQQMNRLAEAGLNPNLVYGNGSVANTAGQPAQAATPSLKSKHYDFSDALPNLGQFISLARMQKEIDVADQNIKESQAREANIREQTFGQGLTNKWLDASFEKRMDKLDYEVENSIADHTYKLIIRGWLPDMQKLEYEKLNQSLRNMVQQYANMCVQQRYTEAQIEYTWKQIDVADNMISKIMSETDLNYQQAEKLYYDTMGSYIDNQKAVFGMYMEAARNPVVGAGIAAGTIAGDFGGWSDALRRAQGTANSGIPAVRFDLPVRYRNKSRRK